MGHAIRHEPAARVRRDDVLPDRLLWIAVHSAGVRRRRIFWLLLKASTWVGIGNVIAWAQTPDKVTPRLIDDQQIAADAEGAAVEQSADEVDPSESPASLSTTERLTGDWGGERTRLEANGITLDMTLTTFIQQVARNGLNTHHAHTILGTNDIELTFDLGKMDVLPDATVYMLTTNAWGKSPTTRGWTGDLFGVNGAEIGERAAIDVQELWFERALWHDSLRIKVGKLSLTTDFDTNAYANDSTTQFMNAAFLYTPNIPFPADGFGVLGIQAIVTPADWLYFGGGVADAQGDFRETGLRTAFDDKDYTFSIFELGFKPILKLARDPLPGNYRIGLWLDSQPKHEFFNDLGGRRLNGPQKSADVGWYTSCDQLVWKELSGNKADAQGLGIFARYGYAPADVNELNHFWSVGSQYQGLFPSRDEDVLGVGIAQTLVSKRIRLQNERPDRETVLEIYYNAQIFPWFSVSPDLQWIFGAGGRRDGPDAFVAGLRMQVSF